MTDSLKIEYLISGEDFTRAGEASGDVKAKLKMMGVNPEVIRKVSIAMYEGEINMVIHANGGVITVIITTTDITMILKDNGPGIKDLDLAMQAGYSTASENVRAFCSLGAIILWSRGLCSGISSMCSKKQGLRMQISTRCATLSLRGVWRQDLT